MAHHVIFHLIFKCVYKLYRLRIVNGKSTKTFVVLYYVYIAVQNSDGLQEGLWCVLPVWLKSSCRYTARHGKLAPALYQWFSNYHTCNNETLPEFRTFDILTQETALSVTRNICPYLGSNVYFYHGRTDNSAF